MEKNKLESSVVLEKLAELDLLDVFYEAVDSDDFDKAMLIMKKARIDSATIASILKEMMNS